MTVLFLMFSFRPVTKMNLPSYSVVWESKGCVLAERKTLRLTKGALWVCRTRTHSSYRHSSVFFLPRTPEDGHSDPKRTLPEPPVCTHSDFD